MTIETAASGLASKGKNAQNLDVLLVSPYHGGSHQAWANGLRDHSQHNIQLLTMPDRFWKWRMHGGALTLAREYLGTDHSIDCLLATDMLDLTSFLALTRAKLAKTPTIIYMHENQLTYPLPNDPDQGPMRRQMGERDLHYAFINLSSMHAADVIFFNSDYHRQELLEALPNFLKHFPDFNELQIHESIERKCRVLPPGVDLKRLDAGRQEIPSGPPPLILWNHRWEYDKGPGRFFEALYQIREMGIPFRLALCGRNYRQMPEEFIEVQEILAPHIIHSGYAEEDTYIRLLWEASIVVSTARHEFFGISTVEAIYCHTLPILPDALSYPEMIPARYHDRCLYSDQEGLVKKICDALQHQDESFESTSFLSAHVAIYGWDRLAARYDSALSEISSKLGR